MIRTLSAGGVVVSKRGLVLVVSQHGTSWSLPKGHIEPGEDAKTAAIREIEEESGIKQLNLIKELGSYERFKIAEDGGEDWSELKTITIFLFSTNEHLLKPIDKDNPEAKWVMPDDVPAVLTHPRDKKFYNSIKLEVISFIKYADS